MPKSNNNFNEIRKYMNCLTPFNFWITRWINPVIGVWILFFFFKLLVSWFYEVTNMIKPFNGNSRTKIWKIIEGIYEKLIWIQMKIKSNVVHIHVYFPVHRPVHIYSSFWSVRYVPLDFGILFENFVCISIDWILFSLYGEIYSKLNQNLKRQNEDNRRDFRLR